VVSLRPRPTDRQQSWDALAGIDPMWAALTSGRRPMEWTQPAFAATGDSDVRWLTEQAKHLGLHLDRDVALDFGCGPGRLLPALAGSYRRVLAIDHSPRMIEAAKEFVPATNIEYLRSLGEVETASVDLVVSTMVLQHMAVSEVEATFAEMARVAKAGGVVVFQFPVAPARTMRGIAFRILPARLVNIIQLRVLRYPAAMTMMWHRQEAVAARASASGLRILRAVEGPEYSRHWRDRWYFAVPAGP
jgi:ubiquinone/menaquinone biosynthesis C-methylase UbiE